MRRCSLKLFLLLAFVLTSFENLKAQTDSVGLPTGIYQEMKGSKFSLIDKLANDTLYLDPGAICTVQDFSGVYLETNNYLPAGIDVFLRFNKTGKKKFHQATIKNLQKKLVFLYDGKLISAPVINSVLNLDNISCASQLSFPKAKQLKLNLEKEINELGKKEK